MKQFARLFTELDATTSTLAKVQALQRYFGVARPEDAAWAVYFLSGGKPQQVVRTATLRALACEMAGIEDWLFDACYQSVGDLAETIAYVLPLDSTESDRGLADWVEQRLLPLRGLPEPEVAERVRGYWRELDPQGRFLLTKLVGGGFRVGVSKLLVQRALAAHAGIDAKRVAQRMMGYTDGKTMPTAARFAALLAEADPSVPMRPTWASRTRSSWPTSWTRRSMVSTHGSARRRTGRWSGSTTASAARWSSAAARYGYGRAAKSW